MPKCGILVVKRCDANCQFAMGSCDAIVSEVFDKDVGRPARIRLKKKDIKGMFSDRYYPRLTLIHFFCHWQITASENFLDWKPASVFSRRMTAGE